LNYDANKEYDESMEELMMELQAKSATLLKKFNEQSKKDKIKF